MKHGTLSGYQHFKCRCNACKVAKREYELDLKKRKTHKIPELVGPKPITHGTGNAYVNHKCRCDECLSFMRGYRLGLKNRKGIVEKQDTNNIVRSGSTDSEIYERKRICGTGEAYSFGCTCNLCMATGRAEYLKMVTA